MEPFFEIGSIKLYKDDAYNFLKNYDGVKFDTVITDPPYGVGIKGLDGKMWDDGYPHRDFWALLYEKVVDGGLLASFCSSRSIHRSAQAVEEAGWRIQEILAWIRPYSIGQKGRLKRGWEGIILASKGRPRDLNIDKARIDGMGLPKWPRSDLPDNNRALNIRRGRPENRKNSRSPSSVVIANEDDGLLGYYDRFFIVGRAKTKEKGEYNTHPSVKPLSLIEHLITLLNIENGLVFDPFVGSGTTLVASLNLRFNCIGVEIEHDYCEIARKRLEENYSLLIRVDE